LSANSRSPEQDRFILHITSSDKWRTQRPAGDRGSGGFRDPSLDTEGFIHCSTVDQFLIPANERFVGRNDLVLLVIDTDRLEREPIYEDCYESGTRFPHVYGPIPMEAVIDVVDLPPDDDGRFSEPVTLRSDLAVLAATDHRVTSRPDQRRRMG